MVEIKQFKTGIVDAIIGRLETELGHALTFYRQPDDSTHLQTLIRLRDRIPRSWTRLMADDLQLVHGEFMLQTMPYVRIARPHCPQDSIGIHRDTHYGALPDELSIVVPLTNVPASGSLRVYEESDGIADEYLGMHEGAPMSEKGSLRHQLGFPYRPWRLSDEVRAATVPIVVPVGSALVMSLDVVHGQECNDSEVPRFSLDFRLRPVVDGDDLARTSNDAFYERY